MLRGYTAPMDHIGPQLAKIDQNIKLNTADPVARDGFTQLPNFILRNPAISIGAKTVYSLFISYAWHNNFCFPGQETLAKAIGMSVGSVNAFIKELEAVGLIEIERRGQGRTNLYTINYTVKPKRPKS
jgi:helix-turn-helix protein